MAEADKLYRSYNIPHLNRLTPDRVLAFGDCSMIWREWYTMVLLLFDVCWCREDGYKVYNELNKNKTILQNLKIVLFKYQDSKLNPDDGNHKENVAVDCCCVLMQHKRIKCFKQDDQKPNNTTQILQPYFHSNNTVNSSMTMLPTKPGV